MLVHKDMACVLCTIVLCEELPPLRHVQLQEGGELLGEDEAYACSAPMLLILMMGQVHVQAMISSVLQLIAMTSAAELAVRVEACACICWDHEAPDA